MGAISNLLSRFSRACVGLSERLVAGRIQRRGWAVYDECRYFPNPLTPLGKQPAAIRNQPSRLAAWRLFVCVGKATTSCKGGRSSYFHRIRGHSIERGNYSGSRRTSTFPRNEQRLTTKGTKDTRICSTEKGNRLSHNCNLAVTALLFIPANSNLAYESCGALSSRN